MLHIAEAKQVERGELPFYAGLHWGEFSQKLAGLGYRQVNEVQIRNVGSLHVLSRHNYSPPSFLPLDEPVHVSSAAMVKVSRTEGRVGYVLMTKPGLKQSVEELAHDAGVMGRYFIDRTRQFETRLLPNGWAVLGIYAAIGFAAGVGIGELIYQHNPTMSTGERYGIDANLGLFSSFIVPVARLLFEYKVRHPVLRMKAASQMNASSYLFGSEAVNSVNNESRALQFETAASLVHAELKSLGLVVDAETFYRAFGVIRDLGVDKAERIAPVARVPLERIVQVVKAHPGLLPAPASAR